MKNNEAQDSPEPLSDATGLPEYNPAHSEVEVTTHAQLQLLRKWTEKRLEEAGFNPEVAFEASVIIDELAGNVVEEEERKVPEDYCKAVVSIVTEGQEASLSVRNSLTYLPEEKREALVERLHHKLTSKESVHDEISLGGRGLGIVGAFARERDGDAQAVLMDNGDLLVTATLKDPTIAPPASNSSHQVA